MNYEMTMKNEQINGKVGSFYDKELVFQIGLK